VEVLVAVLAWIPSLDLLLGKGGAGCGFVHAGVAADRDSSVRVVADPMWGENVFDSWENGSVVNIRAFDLVIYSLTLTGARGRGYVHAIANVPEGARLVSAAV